MEKITSSKWSLFTGLAFLLAALGVFAWAADAPAYLGHEAATCNNCHVMDSHYENWFHAPHAAWTTCVDCHLPHQNFAAYYYEKGRSGMHDVYVFVTKTYPEQIRATTRTQGIVQDNCIRCHLDTVEGMLTAGQPLERNCWDCHRSVAHGERGLSLYPHQDTEVYTK